MNILIYFKQTLLLLQNPSTKQDSYSLIALGNVWLTTLHQPNRDKDKERKNQERALTMYRAVLKADPKNIWAANGIGNISLYAIELKNTSFLCHRLCSGS